MGFKLNANICRKMQLDTYTSNRKKKYLVIFVKKEVKKQQTKCWRADV